MERTSLEIYLYTVSYARDKGSVLENYLLRKTNFANRANGSFFLGDKIYKFVGHASSRDPELLHLYPVSLVYHILHRNYIITASSQFKRSVLR